MSTIKILYDGQDAFAPQRTPFVGVDYDNIYYGELWAKEERLTLNGQLTGCTFDAITAAQNALVQNFKKSYQTLEIWQEENGVSGRVFQKKLTEIDSISFSSERWVGYLPYTITLKCYPSEYFSGAIGILNPSDDWSFQEGANHVGQFVHRVSCRGLNTSSIASNALENARIWSSGRRGLTSAITPIFIENASTGNYCLLTSSEEINRFNGTYAITDTYAADLARTGYGSLRYSTSFESGEKGITVNLQGNVRGCNMNIDGVRGVFQSLDTTATAALAYYQNFGETDLNPVPLSSEIEEDAYTATLNFAYAFDNNQKPTTYFDYTVTLNSGDEITASIAGNVVTVGHDLKTKLALSKAFIPTINLYALTIPFYNNFSAYSDIAPLNPKPITSGISITESDAQISLNAEFTNRDSTSSCLDVFDYTLNFQPSFNRIDSRPRLNGSGIYSLVDLGYANRTVLAIRGDAKISVSCTINDGKIQIRNKCQELFGQYGSVSNAIILTDVLTANRTDQRLVSFDFSWSFDAGSYVFSPPNYSGIDTLRI